MLADEVLESERKVNCESRRKLFIVVLFLAFASVPHGEVLKVRQEVTHTEAGARRFAGVCRSDALLGGSNAAAQAKVTDLQ